MKRKIDKDKLAFGLIIATSIILGMSVHAIRGTLPNWSGSIKIRTKVQLDLVEPRGIVNYESLEAYGDPFPEVTMIVFLKESSFCRDTYELEPRPPSLCSEVWTRDFGFCPYNPFGMNHPSSRETYSLGKLGDFLPDPIPWELRRYNVHRGSNSAVYASIDDAIKDYRLWQEDVFKRAGKRPSTAEEYIAMVKRAKFNPNEAYHTQLSSLYEDYEKGHFQRKFGKALKRYEDKNRWTTTEY